MTKRVAIIAEFSDIGEDGANGRFSYIAHELSDKFDVTLFTSDFEHTKKVHRVAANGAEISGAGPGAGGRPYKVRLVHEPGYVKNVSLKRLRSHKIFARNLRNTLNQEENFDILYCAAPPTYAGQAALSYAREKDVPLIVDIQDIWPEAFELVFHIPLISDVIFGPMRKAIREVYAGADRIVAVSETYAEVGMKYRTEMRRRAVKGETDEGATATVVYLGTNVGRFDEFARSTHEVKPGAEIWVAYIGTLGHSYNIGVVIDALAELRRRGMDNIVFKVMGDGPLMNHFMEYAKSAKIRADFLGRLAYPDMVRTLALSDIAVNPIMPGAAQSIINKVGDYAAAGLPVVSTQDNEEYRDLVNTFNIGYNCSNSDAVGVADAIAALASDPELRRRLGANNRRLAEKRFDRATTYKNIYALLANY
jgi:glycosyltransferase involved in cell wall biosynthesis